MIHEIYICCLKFDSCFLLIFYVLFLYIRILKFSLQCTNIIRLTGNVCVYVSFIKKENVYTIILYLD